MNKFEYEIAQHLGILSTGPKNWTKEANIVKWGGRTLRFDLREWDIRHEKMSKGITMNKAEVIELKRLLNSLDIEAWDFNEKPA